MHEMSYVVRLVNSALDTAKEKKASRVNRLVVSVGEMTGVLPEYMHRYYDPAVRGTLLEGSQLEIREQPVEVLCKSCGAAYHPQRENGYACPECKSSEGEIIAGRSVTLEQVELEYEE